MNTINTTTVMTGKVRLSYVSVFEPRAAIEGAEPKYSVTILVPKVDVHTKQLIDAAIEAAAQVGLNSKWGGVRPPRFAIPVYDGDDRRPSDGMPFGDECKGHWVFSASSKDRPAVVDAAGNDVVMNKSEIYSGIYGRAQVTFFAYAAGGKKGVGCGLNGIQKLEDGEPLSARRNAAEDFRNAPWVSPHQQQLAQNYQQPVQQVSQYRQPQQYQQPAHQHTYTQPQYQQPAQQPQNWEPQCQPVQQQGQFTQELDPITGLPVLGQIMGL